MTLRDLYKNLYFRHYRFNMRIWSWWDEHFRNNVGFTTPNKEISVKELNPGNYEIFFHKLKKKISFLNEHNGLMAIISDVDITLTADNLITGCKFEELELARVLEKDFSQELSDDIIDQCKIVFKISEEDKFDSCPMH